jgi:hypothetical protein
LLEIEDAEVIEGVGDVTVLVVVEFDYEGVVSE